MTTIRDILKLKNREIQSIHPDAKVIEALQKMCEKNVGALVVMEDEKLVGIFSERDYARKIILHGKSSKDTQVREVMTSHLISITPDNTIEEVMVLMTGKHIRHLPVFEDNKFIGIISIGDVLKSVITDKDFLINQLSNYIAGTY